MTSLGSNAFLAYLASSLQSAGNETTFYLDRITTLNGETIATADFATFGRGTITIDPLSQSDIEFASFTGVDAVNIALTGGIRGLSAKSSASSTNRMPYHPVSTPVIIAFGVHNIEDIKTYIDGLFAGTVGNATDTTTGLSYITENLGSRPRAMAALVSQQTSPNMTLKVNPFSLSDQRFDVIYDGGNTSTFTAPVTNPRIDLIVYNASSAAIALRTGTEAVTPVKPTPTQYDIVLATIFHKVGETSLKERDDSTNGYIQRWYYPSIYDVNAIPAGTIFESASKSIPTGYLATDASAVSRTTYAALFTAICPSLVCTITNATPAVITANTHGYVAGDRVHFTTTGSLPSGLSTNTDYYIISTGLTTNAFQVALSPGGTGVATSSAGSGVHTVYFTPYGRGDGSTTFNVPDKRGKVAIGVGASASTITLSFESAAVNTGSDLVTILDTVYPAQGQAVVLTTTGTLPTGLSLATTYYVIRASSTTIKFATSQLNANTATAIDITGAGSGVHTMTYTQRAHTVLGRAGGEDTHGVSTTETASHTHTYSASAGGTGALNVQSGAASSANQNTDAGTGGNAQHNNMQAYIGSYFYIKT